MFIQRKQGSLRVSRVSRSGRSVMVLAGVLGAGMVATATPALAAESAAAPPSIAAQGPTSAQAPAVAQSNDPQSQTQLTIDPNPAGEGEPVTLTATVRCFNGINFAGFPSGLPVTFESDGASLGSVTIGSDGDASIIVDDLPVGTHEITATFPGGQLNGDGQCTGSADSETLTILSENVGERGRVHIRFRIDHNRLTRIHSETRIDHNRLTRIDHNRVIITRIDHNRITKIGRIIRIGHIIIVNRHHHHHEMEEIPVTGL